MASKLMKLDDWCRLVWNRIWAVLSDFFIDVGCHRNLQVRQYRPYAGSSDRPQWLSVHTVGGAMR